MTSMRRRNQLIAVLVAELAGVALLVLLFLLFRVPPAAPGPVPVALALSTSIPTQTSAPAKPSTTPAIAPTVLVTATPSVTAVPLSDYTVADGDTMWGIAVNFNLTLDELVAANPDINPDRLYPGDVVHIPAPAASTWR